MIPKDLTAKLHRAIFSEPLEPPLGTIRSVQKILNLAFALTSAMRQFRHAFAPRITTNGTAEPDRKWIVWTGETSPGSDPMWAHQCRR